jgi:hypothetical protein
MGMQANPDLSKFKLLAISNLPIEECKRNIQSLHQEPKLIAKNIAMRIDLRFDNLHEENYFYAQRVPLRKYFSGNYFYGIKGFLFSQNGQTYLYTKEAFHTKGLFIWVIEAFLIIHFFRICPSPTSLMEEFVGSLLFIFMATGFVVYPQSKDVKKLEKALREKLESS